MLIQIYVRRDPMIMSVLNAFRDTNWKIINACGLEEIQVLQMKVRGHQQIQITKEIKVMMEKKRVQVQLFRIQEIETNLNLSILDAINGTGRIRYVSNVLSDLSH